MNIILDANPLGIGFYHQQAQTGVSRVVEQLLGGLWYTEGINLSLAAPEYLPELMRYAGKTFGASGPVFVNRPVEQHWARLENTLLGPWPPRSLPSKAIREVFYRSRKAVGATSARFETKQWPAGSIYHSPFYPIPRTVSNDRRLRTVQMIHDLIPITHPEWFPNRDSTVRDVLETLPPDAHIVTTTQAVKDEFCQYTRVDAARVRPIHLAASPTLFYPVRDNRPIQALRQRYNLGQAPYLLSLATFEPRKNTDHLIRCFAGLAESGAIPAEVKLVLVGTRGWKFDRIMTELARSRALQSRLVITGFVPDADLAALYSGALGFVYPSLAEGFGLPPLEAMQCGLPVITSDIPAIAEVVGDAALLVPPTDADALAQAMLTVVNGVSLRQELSAKATLRASQFSWDKFVAEHVALYKSI